MIKSMGNGWRSAIEANKKSVKNNFITSMFDREREKLENDIKNRKLSQDLQNDLLSTLQNSIAVQNAMRPLW